MAGKKITVILVHPDADKKMNEEVFRFPDGKVILRADTVLTGATGLALIERVKWQIMRGLCENGR